MRIANEYIFYNFLAGIQGIRSRRELVAVNM